MVPFRVYDRENKAHYIVINYHPPAGPSDEGSYLCALEDDSERDLALQLLSAKKLSAFRLVDFLDDDDGLGD